jgi:hypothetical protein
MFVEVIKMLALLPQFILEKMEPVGVEVWLALRSSLIFIFPSCLDWVRSVVCC